MAAPLTDLTKKSVPNSGVWNEGCQRAFETLKKALISEPVLSSPDVSKTFIVQTDASPSDRGVGAVLSQVQEDGRNILLVITPGSYWLGSNDTQLLRMFGY